VADEIVRGVIPVALTDALPATQQAGAGAASERAEQGVRQRTPRVRYKAPWRTDPNDWYKMHEDLAAALEK
jgi:hypothetical protein